MESSDKSIVQLSKADYTRYNSILPEVKQDFDIITKSLRRLTRNLRIISERRLYLCGSYGTFADFCQKELGRSVKTIYQLIQADGVLQYLADSGIPEADLPMNERICREIRKIKDPENQERAWKSILKITKEENRPPTIHDVQAAAVEVTGSDGAIERQQIELVQKFEGIDRALKVGISFDVLTPTHRRRLLAVLASIVEKVQTLIEAFQSSAVEERTKSKTVKAAQPEKDQ